jgi:tripartite-type tricarboxylate transporter receptor subunit TctC
VVLGTVLLTACTSTASPPSAAPGATAPGAAATTAPTAPPTPAVDFAGKTITLIAASSPGGGTDTLARIMAKHLPQYLPGNPTVVVENMTGAGGLVALNHLCNVSEPDGLTWNAATQRSNLYSQIQGDAEMLCDLRTVSWVGNSFRESDFLILRKDSGFTSVDAIRNASSGPKIGAQSTTDASYVSARVAEEALGIKFSHVLGYEGSEEVVLDMERAALDGRFGSAQQLIDQPQWLADGIMTLLFTTRSERHPDHPDVPTLEELTPAAQKDLMLALDGPSTLTRSFAGPPGVPAEILAVMRDAYGQMSQSPAFIAELTELGFEHFYQPGEVIDERYKEILDNEKVTTLLKSILSEPAG